MGKVLAVTFFTSIVTPLIMVATFPMTIFNVWVLHWVYTTLLPYAPVVMPVVTFGQLFAVYVIASMFKAVVSAINNDPKKEDDRPASTIIAGLIATLIARYVAIYMCVQLTVWYLSQ